MASFRLRAGRRAKGLTLLGKVGDATRSRVGDGTGIGL